MLISVSRNNDYENDTKRFVKMSQEKSSQSVKENDESEFGKRLRIAFNGAINADIARQLSVSEPAIANYIKGRVPPADTLLLIKSLTHCSLDWLLTGDEWKKVNATQTQPVTSKGGKLLQETSLSEIFTNLFERVEKLESQLQAQPAALKSNDILHLTEKSGQEVDAIIKSKKEIVDNDESHSGTKGIKR